MNFIAIHGSGFAQGAAVDILEDWVSYDYGPSPAYHEDGNWYEDFAGQSNFDFETGIQDCSKLGSPGGGTYGEPAYMHVYDYALEKIVYTIPMRAQLGGLCTANQP